MVVVPKPFRMALLVCALAGLVGCMDQDSPRATAVGQTSADIILLCQALGMSYVSLGVLPANQIEMQNVLTNSKDGYLRPLVLMDGWKRPFRYVWKSEVSSIIWSTGPNEYVDDDDISCSLEIDREHMMISEKLRNVFSRPESEVKRPFSAYAIDSAPEKKGE